MKSKSAAEWEAYALANGGTVTGANLAALPSQDFVDREWDKSLMTEKEFMAIVVRHAKDHSWRVYHTYRSDRSEPGFPDLVMARRSGVTSGRVVFAELKKETGKTTQAQLEWLRELEQCGQEAYLWRPSDWTKIVEVLR